MSFSTFFISPFDDDFPQSTIGDAFANHHRALQRSSRGHEEQAHLTTQTFKPRLDLHEGPDNTLTATFELPGLKKEDVSIEVHNNRLTISGEISSERELKSGGEGHNGTKTEGAKTEGHQTEGHQMEGHTTEGHKMEGHKMKGAKTEGTWIVRERRTGKFSRTLELPVGTEVDQIKASAADGILTVTFPKVSPEQTPKKITIN